MKNKKMDMTADQYDSADTAAGAAPQTGTDFSSAYDQAPAAAGSDAPSDAKEMGDDANATAQDLDIPAADVTKMQSLKDSGDMAGLGSYVAQFLN